MAKQQRNEDANTLDFILLLSMPVLTAAIVAAVWYLGHYTNVLAAAAG